MTRIRWTALVLAGALILAACGNDSDPSASTTSTTSTTTSTTTTTVPAEPGPHVGTFYNVDRTDGSPQEITIEAVEASPSGDRYSYTLDYVDSAVTLCKFVVGNPTPASGTGSFDAGTGDTAFVLEDFQFYCRLNGPDDEDWPLIDPFPMQVSYDPETDQLITPQEGHGDRPEDAGHIVGLFGTTICWTREPPGPTGTEAC